MQASDPTQGQLGVPFATSHAALAVAAVTVLAALLVHELSAYTKRRSMPPGPFRWPLIGNTLQVPQVHPWLTYSRWARVYGDIFYLDALGQHIIVINSARVARELLDRRSSIYSGRPHLIMAGQLVGGDRMLIMQPYGDELRQQRRLISQTLSTSTIGQYYDIQEAAARRLVLGVIDNPSSLEGQIKTNIASIIMLVVYGYTVKGTEDMFAERAIQVVDNLSLAATPGIWLADMIPQLKYVPSWMPGISSLKTAKAWRKLLHTTNGMVYQWCKENSENGTAHLPNLCASVLSDAEGKATLQLEESLKWVAFSVLTGGLDTNISTIISFILAMLRFPDVQKKAQAEIDAVVGSERLPQISDRPSLPYIRSVIAETYRWLPATPLSVPHALDEDDIYDGSFLPKGSIIMPNVWHMLHDPNIYPEPDAFKPERYGGSDIEMKKVTDIAFGFGRRACPGFYFAQGTIFSIVVTVLATCDIVPIVDNHGREIIPDVRYSTKIILCPEDVKCTFRPRSEQAKLALVDTCSD